MFDHSRCHRQLRQLPQRHHRHRQECHPYPDQHPVRGLSPPQRLDSGHPRRSRQRHRHLLLLSQRHHRRSASRPTISPATTAATTATPPTAGAARCSTTAGVTGNCASCHNGTTATGKNATHIQTNTLCEDCHRTSGWIPVTRVDHANVIGTCFSCHNGSTADRQVGQPYRQQQQL